eukprot:1140025-Pelagomonas_calceolata.AAC.6
MASVSSSEASPNFWYVVCRDCHATALGFPVMGACARTHTLMSAQTVRTENCKGSRKAFSARSQPCACA